MSELYEQFNIMKMFIKCHVGEVDAKSARRAVKAIIPITENGDGKVQYMLGKYYSWGYHNGCTGKGTL